MLRKTVFLACAALLLVLATSSRAQAWGCYHYRYGGYGGYGGYHAGYTHYGPVTGFHHYSTGGGYGAYGGYHYGTHYGAYRGYTGGYYRRW